MTKTEFDAIFDSALIRLRRTRDQKHSEYANEGETFQNLKDGSRMLGIHPAQYAFVLMTKQYNSLKELCWGAALQDYTPWENADLMWEKVQDIIIYCLLIYGLQAEELQQPSDGKPLDN